MKENFQGYGGQPYADFAANIFDQVPDNIAIGKNIFTDKR